MKKFLLIMAMFCSACSGSTTCTNEPTNPVAVPDAGPALPGTEPEPQPVQEVIDWKDHEGLRSAIESNPLLCVLAHFKDPECSDCNKVTDSALADPQVAKLINKLFLAVRFPITVENRDEVVNDFNISRLPAIIMSPAEDVVVVQIEGSIPPDDLYRVLITSTVIKNCELAKSN